MSNPQIFTSFNELLSHSNFNSELTPTTENSPQIIGETSVVAGEVVPESSDPDQIIRQANAYLKSLKEHPNIKKKAMEQYPLTWEFYIEPAEKTIEENKQAFYDNLKNVYPRLRKKIDVTSKEERNPNDVGRFTASEVESLTAQKTKIVELVTEILKAEGEYSPLTGPSSTK